MIKTEKWQEKHVLIDMRRAIEEFDMIRPHSRILIGISGGKDSIAMGLGLEMLKTRMNIPFETVWLHLDYGAGGDSSALKTWLASYDIDLLVERTDIWSAVENREGGSPCYLCAKLRRGALARMMDQYGCDSMALGHHRDDALATLWMNLIYNGRFRTFHPVSHEKKTTRTTIRPLIYCKESKIKLMRDRMKFPPAPWACPHEGDTERLRMATLRERMQRDIPNLDDMLIQALRHIDEEDKWTQISL